ncbi:MAG TPA: lytic transglycosylase domain-containing protein [Bryobacteraceae bacterium]|nr:lytic transglycosylase domain-containing protein [Bryobacteraceae bacterium]
MRFCLDLVLGATVLSSALAGGLHAGDVAGPRAETAVTPREVWVVRVDPRSGKLVRSMLAQAKPVDRTKTAGTARAGDDAMRALAQKTAADFEVNPLLVDSVIQVESNYNPFAVSAKGAQGLMQLMPATARRFGVTDTFDPKQNIEAGVRYLKLLQDTFQDDRLAIAAYNAGEGAVEKYGDVPPYPETKKYVAKVGQKIGQAQRAGANRAASGAPELQKGNKAQVDEDQPRHILAYVDPEGRLHIATR